MKTLRVMYYKLIEKYMFLGDRGFPLAKGIPYIWIHNRGHFMWLVIRAKHQLHTRLALKNSLFLLFTNLNTIFLLQSTHILSWRVAYTM